MTENYDIDGKFAQGWGGGSPNGVHVNVLLAKRGDPTAASITTAFTSPSPGFIPVLALILQTASGASRELLWSASLRRAGVHDLT